MYVSSCESTTALSYAAVTIIYLWEMSYVPAYGVNMSYVTKYIDSDWYVSRANKKSVQSVNSALKAGRCRMSSSTRLRVNPGCHMPDNINIEIVGSVIRINVSPSDLTDASDTMYSQVQPCFM